MTTGNVLLDSNQRSFDIARAALPSVLDSAPNGSIRYYSDTINDTNANLERNIGRGQISQGLYIIAAIARELHLPPFTFLVVSKQTNLPSTHFAVSIEAHNNIRAACRLVNWEKAGPLITDKLNQLYLERGF